MISEGCKATVLSALYTEAIYLMGLDILGFYHYYLILSTTLYCGFRKRPPQRASQTSQERKLEDRLHVSICTFMSEQHTESDTELKMPPKLVIFAGAPEAAILKWDGLDLLDTFIEPIATFVSNGGSNQVSTPALSSPATAHPSWRSLPLERPYLKTIPSQSQDPHRPFVGFSRSEVWGDGSQGASFFIASEIESYIEESTQKSPAESFGSVSKDSEQALSQFYEESYARHEDVPSSHIAPASEVSQSFGSTEFSYTASSFDSFPRPTGHKIDVPISGHLNNLKEIPGASYLSSIHPQTMTVNLIVGIISLPQPRAIKTRKRQDVELVEILVGDETRSPFGINFWLSSSQASEDTRTALSGLRPQDVVLVRNVALSSFRGKVYGQSLRKEMTKIHLLYRNRIDKSDVGGCYSAADLAPSNTPTPPQLEKARRVREWVLRFVGVGAGPTHREKKKKAFEISEVLPDDTQLPDTQ